GLRGVVSAAMLVALEDLGYADAFDEVYACSSGALTDPTLSRARRGSHCRFTSTTSTRASSCTSAGCCGAGRGPRRTRRGPRPAQTAGLRNDHRGTAAVARDDHGC